MKPPSGHCPFCGHPAERAERVERVPDGEGTRIACPNCKDSSKVPDPYFPRREELGMGRDAFWDEQRRYQGGYTE